MEPRRLLRVLTPRLAPGQHVAVCGAVPELGNWNPYQALPMQRVGIPLWSVELPATVADGTEYKFIILSDDNVIWEEGPNRILQWVVGSGQCQSDASHSPLSTAHCSLKSNETLDFRGLNPWRATGVAVPVFSLRSNDDFGCGDFEDLRLLVDWAAQTGQELIQILPVNDTTMTRTAADSYPYNAISSFALHPLYLRPRLLGEPASLADRERFETLRRRLNEADAVDYPAVVAAKEEYARIIYKEQGAATLASREFADFVAANREWLLPYCAFSVLRDRGGVGEPYSPGLVAHLAIENADGNFFFYAWLQYHLHCQLLNACRYARSRGVAVKGDIPIGVSPVGADVWQHPEFFNLDSSAGAPPDAFAADGQNWGFPTYDWQRMAADGFGWWRERLRHMAQYFDAYRIDHILGFFRIWEIPANVSSGLFGHFSPALPLSRDEIAARGLPVDGLFVEDPRRPGFFHPLIMGHETPAFRALTPELQAAFRALHEDFFYRRHNDFWALSALSKLPALINETPMLACAEDLGMIPACVPDVLGSLQILALEVQRMPKEYGVALADPARYSRLNVATTSTHDMPPLRLWLRERGDDDSPELCERYLREHILSPAMLAVFPIQDWLAIDGTLRRPDPAEEQINIPAVSNHYWRYRLHIPLEKMLKSEELRAKLLKLRRLDKCFV